MVELTVVMWLGTLALLVDYVALAKADNLLTQVVGLAFGLLFWAGFVISSLGYTITTNSGVVLTRSSQMLALLGFLGFAATFVLTVRAVMEVMKSNSKAGMGELDMQS